MSNPLVVELFCGGFGWSAGFLDQGWRAVGFDLEHHPWHGAVPVGASLALQDVLTLDGAQFKDADCIVASPPCQEFSYRAMPFKRCKALGPPHLGIKLFWSCFRIQHEASEAAGRYIPMVVENVKGAQPWVGRSKAHYGSFYLWGDVRSVGGRIQIGALDFDTLRVGGGRKQPGNCGPTMWKDREVPRFNDGENTHKNTGGSWLGQRDGEALERNDPRDMRKAPDGTWKQGGGNHPGKANDGVKVPGQKHMQEYVMTRNIQTMAGIKGLTGRMNPAENGVKMDGDHFSGDISERDPRTFSSRSNARKAASAAIARIPYPLSAYVAERMAI